MTEAKATCAKVERAGLAAGIPHMVVRREVPMDSHQKKFAGLMRQEKKEKKVKRQQLSQTLSLVPSFVENSRGPHVRRGGGITLALWPGVFMFAALEWRSFLDLRRH